MKIAAMILAALVLAGCASQGGIFPLGDFQIVQADTRFNPDGNIVIKSKNNRVSARSPAGGWYTGSRGIFVNPAVQKTPDGKVLRVGLAITNYTSTGTLYGSPNSLGVLESISFLIDGAPMRLPINAVGTDASGPVFFNTVTRGASVDVQESGAVVLSREQYQQIMNAKTLAVQIVGSQQTVTYEATDVAETFQPNLRKFYTEQID